MAKQYFHIFEILNIVLYVTVSVDATCALGGVASIDLYTKENQYES